MNDLKLYERMASAYPDLVSLKQIPYKARIRYYKNMRRKNRQENCIYTLNCEINHEEKKKTRRKRNNNKCWKKKKK